jgi:hypothetical protein
VTDDDELERRLRASLHARADSFSFETPELRPPAPSAIHHDRNQRRMVPGIAIAVVLVVSLGVALALDGRGSGHHHVVVAGSAPSMTTVAPSTAAPATTVTPSTVTPSTVTPSTVTPSTAAPATPARGKPAGTQASPPAFGNPSTVMGGTGASGGVGSGAQSAPPWMPGPCPSDVTVPEWLDGRFCGPAPTEGNGDGPDGVCTGQETSLPCGPGVTVGQYYSYTLPGTCSGLIIFDGRQWVSELPPPTPEPDIDVWMAFNDGGVGWIGPNGAVGFQPYTGQPLNQCSSATPASPGQT